MLNILKILSTPVPLQFDGLRCYFKLEKPTILDIRKGRIQGAGILQLLMMLISGVQIWDSPC